MAENGLEGIERQLRELSRRLERLEGATPAMPPQPAQMVTHPPVRSRRSAAPAPAWRGPSANMEELLGGRVLAWLGGIAIVLGIVFFFGMAISRGWIDEPTRTILGLLGSTSLLITGIWLYEKQARVEAALAAVASALAGLFTTLVVATQIYDLIPAEVGLAGAALVGIVGVAIAVRWDSTVVAAIGLGGALLAPVLVGAETSTLSLMFVAVALVAAVAVLLWQQWNWLSLGAFAVSGPQLIAWVNDNYSDHLVPALMVLVGFGSIYVIAAIGYELRARTEEELPIASWFLLLANVVLVTGVGYYALDQTGHPNGAVAWILGLSAAHIALGVVTLRQPISREIGSLLIAVGLGLSVLGFADALDGPALVAGWAVQAVVLAYLATRASSSSSEYGSNAQRLLAGSVGFLGLALGHALIYEAPPHALFDGVADLGKAVAAIGISAVAALVCGRLFRRVDASWSELADLTGATALIYLASIVIVDQLGVTATGQSEQAGQVVLSAFWTVTGLSALVYGLLRNERRFRLGGLALIGVAIAKVYTYDLAELDELARVLSFIALGLLLLAGAFAYQRIRVGANDEVEVPS
jgi:uncharacterized membrane protein